VVDGLYSYLNDVSTFIMRIQHWLTVQDRREEAASLQATLDEARATLAIVAETITDIWRVTSST